jgi:UDP-N-acetylmuramate: L-alanyl-gamma-D-glutamyl-meso-diaminopimelate ligase
VRDILPRALCRVETFGLGVDADWRADDVRAGEAAWTFRLRHLGADLGEFTVQLGGEHNVRNAVAALAAASWAGVGPEQARPLLAAFRGVKRRLEVKGCVNGVTVYDDFAHHPTAVVQTLRALRGMGGSGRLIAVFEPRSFTSRTRVFQAEFAEAFRGADDVLVAAAHMPGKVPPAQRLSEADLVASIRANGIAARFVPTVPEIVSEVATIARPGDRVAILSNGGFGGIHDKLLEALARGR